MKYLAILVIGFTAQFSLGWSCDLTVYDDPSDVDKCFGRVLDHWIHEGKAQLIKDWQSARNGSSGSLNKAGGLWASNAFYARVQKLKEIRDMKDWLVRDRQYQNSRDITLECSEDDDE